MDKPWKHYLRGMYRILLTFMLWSLVVPGFCQSPNDNLEAWYDLAGNAIDQSGNGLDGTANGPTAVGDRLGIPGEAYSFDGFDDCISFGDVADMADGDFTMAFWIKPGFFPIGESTVLWSKGLDVTGNPGMGGFGFSLEREGTFGKVIFRVGGGGQIYTLESPGWQPGAWMHIVGVRQGRNLRLFINSYLEAKTTIPSATNTDNDEEMSMGCRKSSGAADDGFYNGEIDDAFLFSQALTWNQIRDLNFGRPASVGQHTSLEQLSVFPNPATGNEITLLYPAIASPQKIDLQLQDVTGKTYSFQGVTPVSEGLQLSLPKLSSGIYLINGWLDNRAVQARIVIP